MINHTESLESAAVAAVAACRAVDCQGLAVMLCRDPTDVAAVREALVIMASKFEPGSVFFDAFGRPGSGQLSALDNLILLANLLREHILAGNVH